MKNKTSLGYQVNTNALYDDFHTHDVIVSSTGVRALGLVTIGSRTHTHDIHDEDVVTYITDNHYHKLNETTRRRGFE